MPVGDALVLRDEGLDEFREILENWITRWEARIGRWDLPIFYGPLQWLVNETGISERQLRRIRRSLPHVQYSQAEKILLALGLQAYLDTGIIAATRNPHWNEKAFRKWMEETP